MRDNWILVVHVASAIRCPRERDGVLVESVSLVGHRDPSKLFAWAAEKDPERLARRGYAQAAWENRPSESSVVELGH